MKTARDGHDLASAPRSRQALAALIDVAIVGAVLRRARDERAAVAASTGWIGTLGPELIREQLRSPGQLMLGLRTVDRRTGERVALWRSLAVAGAGVGAHLLTRRLGPSEPTPEQARERERFTAELGAIYERHPTDPDARAVERARLLEGAPDPVRGDAGRLLVVGLGVGLVRAALRRRLAPTIEVDARRR